MAAPLSVDFFRRDTLLVAQETIGQYLCRQRSDGQLLRSRISEVEAYNGQEDKACHAHVCRTKRSAVMFEPGGCYYVYLCYGVHWLLNIVTGDVDYPAAILIRGLLDITGPGRLTKAWQIDGSLNNQLAHPKNGLWLEHCDDPHPYEIIRTPRIGIDYAGEYWKNVPYRFVYQK